MRAKLESLVISSLVFALSLVAVSCGNGSDGTQAESQASDAADPRAIDEEAALDSSESDRAGATEIGVDDDAEARAAMQQLANEMRAQLPRQINEGLRMDAVEPGPGTLMTWYYTNLQGASTAIDPQAEYNTRSSGIFGNFCNPDKSLIRYGVTQHFVFRGTDGVEVTRVIVAPAECDAGFEAMLGRIATRLNEGLPLTIDDVEGISLKEVTAGPGRQMTYFLYLLDRSAAEFGDAEAAYSRFAPHMLANMCATEGIDLFFDLEIAMTAVLLDRAGDEVTQVDVTEEECASAPLPSTP